MAEGSDHRHHRHHRKPSRVPAVEEGEVEAGAEVVAVGAAEGEVAGAVPLQVLYPASAEHREMAREASLELEESPTPVSPSPRPPPRRV